LIVPSAHDKRFCFAIPWYDSIVVGTTDTEYDGDLERVSVEPHEKRYMLDALNARFPGAHFTERDITGEYAGLRPLIKAKGASSTADISREYHLELSPQGLISMAGGKLTTYRRMAKAAVDLVVNQLAPEQDGQGAGPCITDTLMLGGWDSDDEVEATMAIHGKMALDLGLGPDTAAYLPTVYGRRVPEVLMLARGDARLSEKLSANHPYIAAQVTYALLVEGARTLDDVLARRMRLTITDYRAALAVAERVADIMAAHLRWTETTRAAQLETFRKEWLPCTTP
jgi:glycerol-3-phosphate dehydrogenase